MGTGSLPFALMRDWAAAASQHPAYPIDWSGIEEKVPNYGNGDPVFSNTARLDVWPLLLPE